MVRGTSGGVLLGLALVLAASLEPGAASRGRVPLMENTPAYVLAYCHRSPRLPLACPHVLPRMEQPSPHWEVNLCLVGRPGCAGLTWDDLSLVDAGDGNRPPIWSHISIYVGNLTTAFSFKYPTHGRRLAHVDGLFARSRSRAIFLGSYTWGGKRGTLVLAPDYPRGGEQGDHLIFRGGNQGRDARSVSTPGSRSGKHS